MVDSLYDDLSTDDYAPPDLGVFEGLSHGPMPHMATYNEFIVNNFDVNRGLMDPLRASMTEALAGAPFAGTLAQTLSTDAGRQRVPTVARQDVFASDEDETDVNWQEEAVKAAKRGFRDDPNLDLERPESYRWETAEEVARRGDKILNEEEFQASQWYSKDIPWDQQMTERRARDLYSWNLARLKRQFRMRKNPVLSMFGAFAGEALDPINYIPGVSLGFRLWAMSKAGRVLGTGLAGSADAFVNTAFTSLASRDLRRRYGHDVAWETMAIELAVSAAFGFAFGSVLASAGVGIGKIRGNIEQKQWNDLRSAIKENDATIENAEASVDVANDLVNSVRTNGRVEASPTAAKQVDDIAGQVSRSDTTTPEGRTVTDQAVEEALVNKFPDEMKARVAAKKELDVVKEELVVARAEGNQALTAAGGGADMNKLVTDRNQIREVKGIAERQIRDDKAAPKSKRMSKTNRKKIEAQIDAFEKQLEFYEAATTKEGMKKLRTKIAEVHKREVEAQRKYDAATKITDEKGRTIRDELEGRAVAEEVVGKQNDINQKVGEVKAPVYREDPIETEIPEGAEEATASVGKHQTAEEWAKQNGVELGTVDEGTAATVKAMDEAGELTTTDKREMEVADKEAKDQEDEANFMEAVLDTACGRA